MNTAEQKGIEKGRKEGRKEEKIETALIAIDKGFDNKTIHELTGLPLEVIQRLREKKA
jgi:predicted transposase/invertase (TIGR01784 family)